MQKWLADDEDCDDGAAENPVKLRAALPPLSSSEEKEESAEEEETLEMTLR